MIIAQAHGSRRFVGCLDPGTELAGSIMAICNSKKIECAHLVGYGYIEDPVIQQYSRSEKRYLPEAKNEGLFAVASLQGSLSVGADGKPDLTLFVQASASGRGRSKVVAGNLLKAQVLQVEFVIMTLDNLVLQRCADEDTGIDQWLQLLPAGGEEVDLQPMREPDLEPEQEYDEDYNDLADEDLNLREGDWLSHPRLGMCYVITYDGEERVKVKLKSGRIAELMLTMFRLAVSGMKDGGKVWKVEMRKKN